MEIRTGVDIIEVNRIKESIEQIGQAFIGGNLILDEWVKVLVCGTECCRKGNEHQSGIHTVRFICNTRDLVARENQFGIGFQYKGVCVLTLYGNTLAGKEFLQQACIGDVLSVDVVPDVDEFVFQLGSLELVR